MQTIFMFLLLTFFGWIFLFVGLRSEKENKRKAEKERSLTTGKIVDYEIKKEMRRTVEHVLHYPIIEYEADGQSYRERSPFMVNPDEMPVGTILDVYYDPESPSNFHLGPGDEFRRGSRAMVRIGAFWIAACLVFFLVLGTLSGSFSWSTPPFAHEIQIQLTKPFSRLRWELSKNTAKKTVPTETPYETEVPEKNTERPPEKESTDDKAAPEVFEYTVKDNTATLEKYIKGENDHRKEYLEIPEQIDGYTVTGFTGTMFTEAISYGSVSIPGTIQTVPSHAFDRWPFLKTVRMQSGTERIESDAFTRNRLLASVFLPETLTNIAQDAFAEDCKATFYVVGGTLAEQYCAEKGFRVKVNDPLQVGK